MTRKAVFTVTLNKPSDKTVLVDYNTLNGTATVPDDYTAKAGTITFLPGDVSQTIEVDIRDSIPIAIREKFSLVLSAPTNATIDVSTAIATIPAGSEANVNGPLINKGLITNAFHNEQGRGGYFHHNSGTSEGQSIGIEGSFLAYEVLNGGNALEQAAANWYLQNGQQMLDAMGSGDVKGPMLRQPISSDPDTLTLLHWLFSARGEIPLQQITYDELVTPVGGTLTIFPNERPAANSIYRVFRIFPSTSKLIYESPYSGAYDEQKTSTGGNVTVKVWSDSSITLLDTDYVIAADGTVTITIPTDRSRFSDQAPDTFPAEVGDWYVVYGYSNAGTLKQGLAQEAYPMWTEIADGYSACAPDTFRWFENAMTVAIQHDPRPASVMLWQHLRANMRRTAVKGQAITDGRMVIEPMPQFPVFPASGDPTGMYQFKEAAFSLNPPGTDYQPYIGISGVGINLKNSAGTGWMRQGGEGGGFDKADWTWTPEEMLDASKRQNFSDPKHSFLYGSIHALLEYSPFYNPRAYKYPTSHNGESLWPLKEGDRTYYYSVGRGIDESFRSAQVYQDRDQYLFVAYKGKATDSFTAYVSTSQVYSADTRWENKQPIEINPIGSDSGAEYVRYFLFDLDGFKNSKTGAALAPDARLFNAAFVLKPTHVTGQYRWKQYYGSDGKGYAGDAVPEIAILDRNLIAMRLVSGASKQWVKDNIVRAVKGSILPWYPGAMPFAINADTIKQRIVGWSGSPFHGYQLPDYWYVLGDDAVAIHGAINPATDLPCASTSGALTYPISLTTAGGVAKPAHAMLAEQQLLFLKAAADHWVADGGAVGGFAHTFVMNTAARQSLGSPAPTPHTWVYTNDDPNTRWCGYAARVVESLSRLVLLSKDDTGWTTANALALDMAYKWVNMLNTLWPNLNGKPYADPDLGNVTLYGAPTDYPDPHISAPQTLYEEPHAPSLVLRAVLWLNLSGKLTAGQKAVADAVGKRCWDYMEMRYRSEDGDSMQFTWANITAKTAESYYGFWQFEIITTIAQMLKNPTAVPAGINLATARQRLRETQTWVAAHTEY